MLNAIELRQDRAALIKQMGEIVNGAAKAKRSLTSEEEERWNKLDRDAEGLGALIEKLETQEARENELIESRLAARDAARAPEGSEPEVRAFGPKGEPIRILRPDQRFSTGSPRESRIALGRIVRGMVTGEWSGVDMDEMRDLSGGSTIGGGVLLPVGTSARIVDLARAKARVIQAGAMTIEMEQRELTVAQVTGDPTAYWRPENAAITSSDLTFGGVTLRAKTLGVVTKASVELIEDAANLGALVESVLAEVLGVELDRAALLGIGAESEPLGLQNVSGVNTTASIGSPTYDDFLDGMYAVEADNGTPRALIAHPRTFNTLNKLVGTANDHYITPPAPFAALKKLDTTSVPITLGGGANESLAFLGDFSNLWIGLRTRIVLEASRVAADSSGSAFKNLQVWIRGYLRADVACVRPSFFWVGSGITA